MIENKIQENTVMLSTIFRFLLVKLRIQLSDLFKMTSYRANENEAVQLFSRLIIVASLFIVCIFKKMATQRPNIA